jgi:hypothetical protein
MKLCKACGCEKAKTEFHKDRSKADGLNAYCKPCQIARQKVYALRPPRHKAPEGMKRCQHCKETKSHAEFHASARTFDRKDNLCKQCRYERHDAWRRANPEKAAEAARKWRKDNPERSADHSLKANYGIALGTYSDMVTAQNGKCAICASDKPGGKGRFHVDHCHDTGEIRGLLCHNCNLGIGYLKHDPRLFDAAKRYVEVFSQTSLRMPKRSLSS